jgi:ThiF family
VTLPQGRLPPESWDVILAIMREQPCREVLVAVTCRASAYRLVRPAQIGASLRVVYRPPADAVLEIHSHGPHPAHFSGTDDADEQGLRIYGVVGHLERHRPEVTLRVGVYGHFLPVPWETVFAGDIGKLAISTPIHRKGWNATMSYLIDPGATGETRIGGRPDRDATIVLVGCGGTGSILAEAVCRLLIDRPGELYLVDMDRVEPHIVARQAFDRRDLGRFKARVLAERLAHRFGRSVGYSVLPYDREMHARVFGTGRSRLNLLLGCVDTAAGRRAIAATLDERPWSAADTQPVQPVWWLDCGSGRNAGQVLLGNVTRPEGLRRAFDASLGRCRALPAPSLQRPDLLDAPPAPQGVPDCAESVAHGDQ